MADLRERLCAALSRAGGDTSDFDASGGVPAGFSGREAGVLAAFLPDGRLILTRRASGLRHHAGQIALPGGKVDPGDRGPVGAALREAHEEIGLPPSRVEVLGTLPPHRTVTGFAMTPVLALVGGTARDRGLFSAAAGNRRAGGVSAPELAGGGGLDPAAGGTARPGGGGGPTPGAGDGGGGDGGLSGGGTGVRRDDGHGSLRGSLRDNRHGSLRGGGSAGGADRTGDEGDFVPLAEPGEVAEVFCLPFFHVADPANYRLERRRWRGEWRSYHAAPWGPWYLWGATARVLHGLALRLTP